jgi:hypothetical protein
MMSEMMETLHNAMMCGGGSSSGSSSSSSGGGGCLWQQQLQWQPTLPAAIINDAG